MRAHILFSVFLVLTFAWADAVAGIRLPKLFGDGMILQRHQPIPVWGWANPNDRIQVSFREQVLYTHADQAGKWMIKLNPEGAGGPYCLEVRNGEGEHVIKDVWVGDVWLCSGQSNMEMTVGHVLQAKQAIKGASYPLIRQFRVPAQVSKEVADDVGGDPEWCAADSAHADEFTAVGYFFARELQRSLAGVPIGLINASRGATTIEPWIAEAAFKSEADLSGIVGGLDTLCIGNLAIDKQYTYPTLLFNTMIHPLIPYAFKGVLWYQGEGNVGGADRYRRTFPLLINDWRARWAMGDFPFYFVQLSSFDATKMDPENKIDLKDAWAALREAQESALRLKYTGMAVTTDVGDPDDIHPQNKEDVGKRLAALALRFTYDKEIIYSGPKFRKLTKEKDRIVLYFDEVNGGLCTRGNEKEVRGFELAVGDAGFRPIAAEIIGETVVLKSVQVEGPFRVRYSWTDDAGQSNLFNSDGFPAAPFRVKGGIAVDERKNN